MSPPPDSAARWDGVEAAEFSTDAAALRLVAVTAEVCDEALIVTRFGEDGIRAHVAQTAPYPTELSEEFARGLERWLIQVWPLG